MASDEQQIRDLVATWMSASQSGDVETVLSLMTDDRVFLRPGQPPLHEAELAAAARAQPGEGAPCFAGRSEVQEIRVLGDWAFTWTRLTVVATPPGGEPITRAGHTLSILEKRGGRWQLAHDANMLAPVPPA